MARSRQSYIEQYNGAIETEAKPQLYDTIKTAFATAAAELLGSAKSLTPKFILDTISKINPTILPVSLKIKPLVNAFKNFLAYTLGDFNINSGEYLVEESRKLGEELRDKTYSTGGSEFNVGIVGKTNALSTVIVAGTEFNPDLSGTGLMLKLNGAKVKLNSMTELVDIIKIINNKLNQENASVVREWVHLIQNIHPIVNDKIKELRYFKPISNEVGSTYLMHTSDTQTLALEDWETELPRVFRRSLEYKGDDSFSKINRAYFGLNQAMVRNISTEFYYNERKTAKMDQGNNFLNKKLLSNDYHIAGDYTFYENHAGILQVELMTALIKYVGGAGKLINWLNPINNYEKSICSDIKLTVEGGDVLVDLRGNKVGVIASIIDETPIAIKAVDYV